MAHEKQPFPTLCFIEIQDNWQPLAHLFAASKEPIHCEGPSQPKQEQTFYVALIQRMELRVSRGAQVQECKMSHSLCNFLQRNIKCWQTYIAECGSGWNFCDDRCLCDGTMKSQSLAITANRKHGTNRFLENGSAASPSRILQNRSLTLLGKVLVQMDTRNSNGGNLFVYNFDDALRLTAPAG